MATIVFSGNSSVSSSVMRNVYNNLYSSSPTFAKMMDYINRHEANPSIVVSIQEAPDDGAYMATQQQWEGDPRFSGSPWPFLGTDYAIIIDPQSFDGNYYLTDSGVVFETLERLYAHEFVHVYQALLSGNPDASDSREEQATDLSDDIMAEVDPDLEYPRGDYDNPPINGPVLPPFIKDPSPEDDPSPFGRNGGPLAQLIDNIKTLIGLATGRGSPLVLDLNHSNTIDLISLENSQAYFDRDQDGYAEWSGVVAKEDGYLAIDLNGNGRIDDNGELFGTMQINGFSILAQYDSNLDGVISNHDEIWGRLIIWQDLNENGYSEINELYSLLDHNIVSIGLDANEVSQVNQGHTITHTSTFAVDDGVSGLQNYSIKDVWFEFDNVNTTYIGSYDLSIEALMLPINHRGYGVISDLVVSMSVDSVGAESLLSLVQSLHEKSLFDLFSDPVQSQNDVRDIMYRWAGVDGIGSSSRGSFVDGQELAFLEKMTGQPFLQRGYYVNPRGPEAGGDLQEAFHIAFNHIYANLMAQSAAGDLFEGDWSYDVGSDSLVGVSGLNSDILDDLELIALSFSNTGERQTFWENVVRMIEYSVGTSSLDSGDLAALQNAITGSDATLDLEDDILPALIFIHPTGLNEGGTGGDDVFGGSSGDDRYQALGGNDIIDGNQGADYLFGGSGNDQYIYNVNDGHDSIQDSQGIDKIVFGSGIDLGDLTFTRTSAYDLLIDIDNGSFIGSILLENHFMNNGSIETIEFSDSSTYDLTSVNWTQNGTNASEKLYGAQYGGGPDDTIYAEDGDDLIYGYLGANHLHGGDGNDTIYAFHSANINTNTNANYLYGDAGSDTIYGSGGADHIWGGTGNDVLRGNQGNDSYYFNLNDGHDTIVEQDFVGNDTLYLGAGIVADDVTFIRHGAYDLKILINGGQNGSIISYKHFSTAAGSGAIESVVLADSTVFDLTTMSFGQIGTAADETLYGNNSGVGSPDDTIYGEGGNDVIYGYLGSDKLHGGDGNDTIYIGSTVNTHYGKTTVNYAYGDAGDDLIYGSYGTDHIHGGTGNDYMMGRNGNDHYYINRAEGVDEIKEVGFVSGANGIDILHLGPTIDADDLTYARDGNYNLKILINSGSGGTINVTGQFQTANGNGAVEYIYLNDNTQIDLRTLNYTLIATDAAETLHGTQINSAAVDLIYGMGGNDGIYGYLGGDTIYGGDGNDVIYAYHSANVNTDTESNWLYGDAGDDSLYGSGGADHIYGGTGNDTMSGNKGADHYYFNMNDGDDTIDDVATGVGEASDVLHFGLGISSGDLTYVRDGNFNLKILVNGGVNGSVTILQQFNSGAESRAVEFIEFSNSTQVDLRTLNYTLIGTAIGETMHGTQVNSAAVDTIYGMGGNDAIYGYLGGDTIYGGDGNDVIYAYHSANINTDTESNWLYGDAGADTLHGSGGADHLYGGTDNDTLSGNKGSDHYYFNLNDGDDIIDDIYTGAGETSDVLHFGAGISSSDLTYVRDGNYNLKILVNGGANGSVTLTGQFHTGAGNGAVEYIEFSDTTQIDLRTLNYTLVGTAAGETLNGTQINSAANDTIYGMDGNDAINGYGGEDVLYGGGGNDTIYGYMNVNINTDTVSNWLYGEDGTDILYGSGGADYLDGGIGNDTINGNNGDDTIIGGVGDDILAGGSGNDIYVYSSGLDNITDNAGTDTLYLDTNVTVSDISFTNVGTYNTKIVITASTDEITLVNLRHNTVANRVDFIEFTDGFKTSLPDYAAWMNGTSGSDTLTGTSGDDTIIGKDGNDTLSGAGGNDDIHGGSGNDTLYGGAGADLLHGGVGNDTLYGQDGLDTLFGGAGADTFVFETATAFNNLDVIKDFSVAQNDVLDLSDLLGGYDPLTDAITDFVWITESAGSSNIFVDRDGLGGTYSLVAIATLSGVTGLTDEAALLSNGTIIA